MEKRIHKKILFLVILLGSLLLALGFILIIIFTDNGKDSNNVIENNVIKENKNESINEIKTLKELTFESTKIVYSNGMSTLTTQITNNSDEEYTKDRFNIIIKDNENNVIITLSGLIMGGLKPKESKLIVSSVDLDLSSDAYYIEYEEVE